MKRVPARDVDTYLAAIPEAARDALEKLRRIIKAAAPQAIEVISYKIPIYKYKGHLVGFSASRQHCSFHIMSPTLMNAFKHELKEYETTTATIHFSVDKPLPAALVTKLVKARIDENERRTSGT
jgi:uncharacterized protein YdhG (YjbR/CyaY superfamily)